MELLLLLLLMCEWTTVVRLPVSVHADRDNGLHGITSRDRGLLAGVDVFLPSLLRELAETMPMKFSQKPQSVSTVVAEVGQTTDSTHGVTTTDGTVAELSNSDKGSVETTGRKCPEKPGLASAAAIEVRTNMDSESGVTSTSDFAAGLDNSKE